MGKKSLADHYHVLKLRDGFYTCLGCTDSYTEEEAKELIKSGKYSDMVGLFDKTIFQVED